MKAFLEEYGLIVVSAIVILLFVGISYWFGPEIKDNVQTMVESVFTEVSDTSSIIDMTEGAGGGGGGGGEE